VLIAEGVRAQQLIAQLTTRVSEINGALRSLQEAWSEMDRDSFNAWLAKRAPKPPAPEASQATQNGK
jgi:hypothetical protein